MAQVPLNKLLNAIDTKDRDFYDNLSEEDRKGFSGYIAMRWASSVTRADMPDLEEYYLRRTNINANKSIFDLSKHPKLQWLMVTTISPGMGTFNHNFVKAKPKPKGPKADIKKTLTAMHPMMKAEDIELLSTMVTKKELTAFRKTLGEGAK